MVTPISSGYLNQKIQTVSDLHSAANGVRFLNTLSLINNHLSWITIVFAKCIYLGDARIRSEPNISESSDAAGVNYSEKLHSAHVEKWSIHCEQKIWKLAGCHQAVFTFRQNCVFHPRLPFKAEHIVVSLKLNLLRHNLSQLLVLVLLKKVINCILIKVDIFRTGCFSHSFVSHQAIFSALSHKVLTMYPSYVQHEPLTATASVL